MSATVIAEFPAAEGKFVELCETMRAALPDTRAFDGCEEVTTLIDDQHETLMLVERWASHDHYDRYLAWRVENGLAELLEPLVKGGAGGFVARKCQASDI
tara:strand:- start:2177 stop:2476 length:300 start_codon:yes stop_codon:yes gene_type:complete